ncbi:hypothetical protein [Asanoa iriomotensis]|uniref:Uncharacterized protein n=1 Tax=Asanoa iriomotensis TaxID=234613 RepID=A0ABQ4CET3_9ACTN|nr:hypothetical protein [Asanoa iriomotensis]GIF61287.1 hypothetical protein Air01nite_73820 [Asanoa iriomotensis]
MSTTYPQTSTPTPTTRPGAGRAAPWLAGGSIALLACALVSILAQAADDFRWWSLFVVIPTSLIAAAGFVSLVRGGGILAYALGNVGLVAFAVGVMLMFGDVPRFWPLLISLPAAAIAGSYWWRPNDPLGRSFHRTLAMLASIAVLLGLTFLGIRFDWFHVEPRWWAWFMVAAGVVVVGNGAELIRHRMVYRVSAAALAAGPGIVTILLGIRFLRGWWF